MVPANKKEQLSSGESCSAFDFMCVAVLPSSGHAWVEFHQVLCDALRVLGGWHGHMVDD